jgi:hypothetical protein
MASGRCRTICGMTRLRGIEAVGGDEKQSLATVWVIALAARRPGLKTRAISSRRRLRSSTSVEVLENWRAGRSDSELN